MSNLSPQLAADVVVVGASFAGAACALAAAQRGLRVVVLERKRDPGEKLRTTGIIVKEAAEATYLNLMPARLTRRIEAVQLYSPALKSLALAAPDYYFLATDTPEVMRWLAGELRAHGVDLRLGASFTGCTRSERGWRVDGVGETAFLVGADGARSRVARHCGLGRCAISSTASNMSSRRAPGQSRCAALLHQQALRARLHRLAAAKSHRRAGRPGPAPPPGACTRADIDEFLLRVGVTGGLPRLLKPGHVRAGLIPCGGPVREIARDGAILSGDAAGIVSPVTAGGIHSAWEHGWTVGEAIASHLRDGGPAPEAVAVASAPKFRRKRALRWAFDHFQYDWPFDLLLHTAPLRWAAEHIYFRMRQSAATRPDQKRGAAAAASAAPDARVRRSR
jgi:flavin-dependent dehydrogenase